MLYTPSLVGGLVFTLVVLAIVLRRVDEVAAALAGAVVMVALIPGYTAGGAFRAVDWDVMAILLGMWIITAYMVRGGLADAVVSRLLRVTRSYRTLIVLLALTAGFLSILVDNVLVILLFGALALDLAEKAKADPVLAVLLVGFSANFMGTAMLMGDLPPQLLHAVAGYEFTDFIWWRGAPGSFPLLTIVFLIVTVAYAFLTMRGEPAATIDPEPPKDNGASGENNNRLLLLVSTLYFTLTIIGMALRPRLGVPLGYITITGASLLALTVEILRATSRSSLPAFPDILGDVEWRALLFYASLFALVGGLQASGALESAAERIAEWITRGPMVAYSVTYWMTAALSTVIEHDALLLTLLYAARDAAHAAGVNPDPLYWGMAWAATLASNTTTAAAPALYVAVVILEKKGYKITGRTFLKYSVPYSLLSLTIMYLLTATVWLPIVG